MQVWNLLHAARCKYRTQKVAKNRHLGTIAQLCRAISLQLRHWHVSTIGKNLLSSNTSSMDSQYGELRPTNGWDRLTRLGHPCEFQMVSGLGSITARHLVLGVSQTLRRWTEGSTYIRQGDHHVGHWPVWPTFLVLIFYDFGLKMPSHASKKGVLRIWLPIQWTVSSRPVHKRHLDLAGKHVVWRTDRQNRSTGAGWVRAEDYSTQRCCCTTARKIPFERTSKLQ